MNRTHFHWRFESTANNNKRDQLSYRTGRGRSSTKFHNSAFLRNTGTCSLGGKGNYHRLNCSLDMALFTRSLVLSDFKPDTYYFIIHYCYNSVLFSICNCLPCSITRQLESDGHGLVPPTPDLRDFVISLRSLINLIKRILT